MTFRKSFKLLASLDENLETKQSLQPRTLEMLLLFSDFLEVA